MQSNIKLIQDGWKIVMADHERAGTIFYTRLFLEDPELRKLFGHDITQQRRRLILMIDSAVKSADYLDEMGQQFSDLGLRHVDYGVRPEDFPSMQLALMAMLRVMIGDDWDQQQHAAWDWLFEKIVLMMTGQELKDRVPKGS